MQRNSQAVLVPPDEVEELQGETEEPATVKQETTAVIEHDGEHFDVLSDSG